MAEMKWKQFAGDRLEFGGREVHAAALPPKAGRSGRGGCLPEGYGRMT